MAGRNVNMLIVQPRIRLQGDPSRGSQDLGADRLGSIYLWNIQMKDNLESRGSCTRRNRAGAALERFLAHGAAERGGLIERRQR